LWRSCAATAAQPTAFLLANDIQAPTTQPLKITFTCPRKLDNQLRDGVAGTRADGDYRGSPQRSIVTCLVFRRANTANKKVYTVKLVQQIELPWCKQSLKRFESKDIRSKLPPLWSTMWLSQKLSGVQWKLLASDRLNPRIKVREIELDQGLVCANSRSSRDQKFDRHRSGAV
jgi:hypothetical protein